MKEALIQLLKVKSLMSIAAIIVFVYMAVTVKMDVKDTQSIILMVFSAYFAVQGNKSV
jgi:hypothetical protein